MAQLSDWTHLTPMYFVQFTAGTSSTVGWSLILSPAPPSICIPDAFAVLMVQVVRKLLLSLVLVDGLLSRMGLPSIAFVVWFLVGSPSLVVGCLCFRVFFWFVVIVLRLSVFLFEETLVHNTFSSDHRIDGKHRVLQSLATLQLVFLFQRMNLPIRGC